MSNKKKKQPKKYILSIVIVLICMTIFYVISHKKNNNSVSSNLEANIQYIQNLITFPLENNSKLINDYPITITWDIKESGTITYPNKKTKTINKEILLSEPGKYKITVGKTSKEFEIIEENIEKYISFDASTNTITINNIDGIDNIEIDNSVFSKTENNIPTEYIFKSKGRYTININTVTNKALSKTYRIQNDI